MNIYDRMKTELELLKNQGNFRQFLTKENNGKYIYLGRTKCLNLSSNDYLGISEESVIQIQFLHHCQKFHPLFSSSSSRLLTGNYSIYEQLEKKLSDLYQAESSLVFNSGYHMNIGIIPAISHINTLILSDELVHASLIDGIRLAKKGKLIIYKHNDLSELEEWIYHYRNDFEQIIIVTESIFSMDGDICNLKELVTLKKKYHNLILYVDEAHAFGVRGKTGLGCAEQYNCINDIDFLVGTFGKAAHSIGGFLICKKIIKDYLINYMKPLIYSTALPPMNIAWTQYILDYITQWQDKRIYLSEMSHYLINQLNQAGIQHTSSSHIIPIIIGNNQKAIKKSKNIMKSGYYILPIRYPSVKKGTERLRISLTTLIEQNNIDELVKLIIKNE